MGSRKKVKQSWYQALRVQLDRSQVRSHDSRGVGQSALPAVMRNARGSEMSLNLTVSLITKARMSRSESATYAQTNGMSFSTM